MENNIAKERGFMILYLFEREGDAVPSKVIEWPEAPDIYEIPDLPPASLYLNNREIPPTAPSFFHVKQYCLLHLTPPRAAYVRCD